MYYITKVINNNIVCSVDSGGNEIILRGLGIGFQKKVKDEIPKEKIEKIYKISNASTSNKLQELLKNIPLEYVSTCTEIIEYAKKVLGKRLNDNIYITLTDHISFAIERKQQDLEYTNALLSEIRSFYSQEYEIGIQALAIIEEKLGIRLSLDEAGFIALHIINAELDTDMSNMVSITNLIQNAILIVKEYYNIEWDEESLHCVRFVTHLKFFGQRLFQNKITKDDDIGFQNMVKKRYPKDYGCALKIKEYIEGTFKRKITEEEMVFLTVHLRRITSNSDCD
ncbi:BglG family transcription antiterminator LicT [Anaerosacchariphilus polymeriproducens]|uniref:BglG family transcription antiterminator LicT n=1 Tax=Anaerosacchariphilus polymeriproducens TaxID=1812858 RepID=UPI001F379C51|nr:PRD domain-containing protein [Anaerosacchariphilus polymeriproducens]